MPDVIEPVLRALAVIAAVIVLSRINGLRSFSKMSSFDFALTVATGSLLAGAIQGVDRTLWIGLVALVAVFAIQHAIAILRQSSRWVQDLTDNEPLLLVPDGRILHDHLRAARVTPDDLFAKLREANVLSLAEVRAVVLETTGDFSVLHASDGQRRLDPDLLTGVRTRL
jgi:uncharacterized membrane protein YcaP (DUF421 family)